MEEKIKEICGLFGISGKFIFCEEITVGNVNKTYKVNFRDENGTVKSYVVQQINTYVFRNPSQVMENIEKTAYHINKKKPDAPFLHYHHTTDGKSYIHDKTGYWRLCDYIPSITFNNCDDLGTVRSAGEAFGEFQMLLSDFDASTLYETIPDFHNTIKRYETLEHDAKDDPCGRVKEVKRELDWLFSVKEKACKMTEMKNAGLLPLRVTHNDTKINNVLFDKETKKALTVIDLDTVMPGLVGHDFGDAIRSAANYVAEDSKEYDKAGVNLDIFEAFARGFISKTAHTLTENELSTLALGGFVLACEQAVRFADDYITGDKYYKTLYPEHNLIRTRCQIALAKDMLEKLDIMNNIVHDIAENYVK